MAAEQIEEDRESGKVMAIIEKATNSTESEVDPRLLKAIKTIVRYSDFELKLAAQTLMHHMKRQHSQVFQFLTSVLIYYYRNLLIIELRVCKYFSMKCRLGILRC